MSVFGSSNPPSVKLPTTPGSQVSGLIVDLMPERQATKFQTPAQRAAKAPRELDFWPAKNGEAPKAKMQQGIVIQLDPGFHKLTPSDTGLRTLYVTEGDPRSRAFRAYNKANRQAPEKGLHLVLEFIGEEAGQGDRAKQLWKVVSLEARAATGGGVFGGDDDDYDDDDDVSAEIPVETIPAPAVPKARPRARAAAAPPSGNTAI